MKSETSVSLTPDGASNLVTMFARRWAVLCLAALVAPLVIVTAHVARVLSPLPGYDTSAYTMTYWFVLSVVSVALVGTLLYVVGLTRLQYGVTVTYAALGWPGPASNVQLMIAVTAIVTVVGTLPHYTWAIHAGSAGTAPFSRVEAAALWFLWRPILSRLSVSVSIWAIMTMIAVSWAVVGLAVSLVVLKASRDRNLSIGGVSLLALLLSSGVLWILRIVWPLTLPS